MWSFTIPHALIEVPSLGVYADKDWPEDVKIYAAMVSRLDSYVGEIVEQGDPSERELFLRGTMNEWQASDEFRFVRDGDLASLELSLSQRQLLADSCWSYRAI